MKRLVRGIVRRLRPARAVDPSPEADPPPEAAPARPVDVDVQDALRWARDGAVMLDVREPNELYAGHVAGALLVPMRQVESRLAEIPSGTRVVAYCAAGARSHAVAELLRARGYPDVWSLEGGFGAWAHAGGATVRPPTNAKFGIAQAVAVDGRPATVQGILETPEGMRYAVNVLDAGRVERLSDVEETRLARAAVRP